MTTRFQFYTDGLTTRPILSRRYGVVDTTYPTDEHGRPTGIVLQTDDKQRALDFAAEMNKR